MLHLTAFLRILLRRLPGSAFSREASVRTTTLASSIIFSVISFVSLFDMSIPTSSIASMTSGLTCVEGKVPALDASSPSLLANPSAIWLLLEFSMHTNSTVPFAPSPRPANVLIVSRSRQTNID